MNRAEKRKERRLRAKPQGHPGKRKSYKEKLKRFTQPDASEQTVQELNRLMREEMAAAPDGDGMVTGPLAVAATYAAKRLVEIHGLQGEDDLVAVRLWLVGNMGDVISSFDPKTYKDWRSTCIERAKAVSLNPAAE